MPTERSPDLLGLAPVESRQAVAGFEAGAIASEAGALLLGATDGGIRLVERSAACFRDSRHAEFAERSIATLVAQRIGPAHTQFAEAVCGTIRLAPLKIGAPVSVSVSRIKLAMASAYPHEPDYALAHARLSAS